MTKRNEHEIIVVLSIILFVLVVNLWNRDYRTIEATGSSRPIIVLDAGHGGFDPGKVGVNDVLEKDINLAITLKVKSLLEQEGYQIKLTRSDDNGLYSENDSNKKRTDMQNRKKIINSSGGHIIVSIHQNSYHESKYKGAQVFYYTGSVEGKSLAEKIQAELIRVVDGNNKRDAKNNGDYFILRESAITAVIVECGFLSNWEEANLLKDDRYQDKIAWAIHLGIVRYMNDLHKETLYKIFTFNEVI